MYRMTPLVADVRRHLNDAIKTLAQIPATFALAERLAKIETSIDLAQGRLSLLEKECRAKEPTS